MTQANVPSVSVEANAAAKPLNPKPQKASKGKMGKKAAKRKNARQKPNQRNRKTFSPNRNFKLTPEALKELRAENGKGFVNPYREGSSYHACVTALKKLGVGSFHAFDKIVPAVISEMGDAAKNFKAKEKRSDETGKDWRDRIVQNVKVVARPDYGAKLRQLGYEVCVESEKGAGLFKLGSK